MAILEPTEDFTCQVGGSDSATLRRIRRRLTAQDTAERLAATFGALADTARLRIVEALSIQELCVCDLATVVGLTQSATSHHLRTLRNLRLVKHRRDGKQVFYSLDDVHILGIFMQGLDHVREGA